MLPENITILRNEGEEAWEGFYINGKLRVQSCCLDIVMILKMLGIDHDVVYKDAQFFDQPNICPEMLKE